MVSLFGVMVCLVAVVGGLGYVMALYAMRDRFLESKMLTALRWASIVIFAGWLIFIAGRVFRHWLP